MTEGEDPAWVGATTRASVRLAAEADVEVDDILEHAERTSLDQFVPLLVRLSASADPAAVASDLAGLLWAEGEDVQPVATILGAPSVRAAVDAVAEARRLAARRLADGAVAETQRRLEHVLAPGRNAAPPETATAPVAAAVAPQPSAEPQPAPPTIVPDDDSAAARLLHLSTLRSSFLSWTRRARPAVGRACREVPWC